MSVPVIRIFYHHIMIEKLFSETLHNRRPALMLPVEMFVHQQCAAEKHVCALSPPHYVTTSVGFVAAQIGVRFIRDFLLDDDARPCGDTFFCT